VPDVASTQNSVYGAQGKANPFADPPQPLVPPWYAPVMRMEERAQASPLPQQPVSGLQQQQQQQHMQQTGGMMASTPSTPQQGFVNTHTPYNTYAGHGNLHQPQTNSQMMQTGTIGMGGSHAPSGPYMQNMPSPMNATPMPNIGHMAVGMNAHVQSGASAMHQAMQGGHALVHSVMMMRAQGASAHTHASEDEFGDFESPDAALSQPDDFVQGHMHTFTHTMHDPSGYGAAITIQQKTHAHDDPVLGGSNKTPSSQAHGSSAVSTQQPKQADSWDADLLSAPISTHHSNTQQHETGMRQPGGPGIDLTMSMTRAGLVGQTGNLNDVHTAAAADDDDDGDFGDFEGAFGGTADQNTVVGVEACGAGSEVGVLSSQSDHVNVDNSSSSKVDVQQKRDARTEAQRLAGILSQSLGESTRKKPSLKELSSSRAGVSPPGSVSPAMPNILSGSTAPGPGSSKSGTRVHTDTSKLYDVFTELVVQEGILQPDGEPQDEDITGQIQLGGSKNNAREDSEFGEFLAADVTNSAAVLATGAQRPLVIGDGTYVGGTSAGSVRVQEDDGEFADFQGFGDDDVIGDVDAAVAGNLGGNHLAGNLGGNNLAGNLGGNLAGSLGVVEEDDWGFGEDVGQDAYGYGELRFLLVCMCVSM
jgi:hypothetical protein